MTRQELGRSSARRQQDRALRAEQRQVRRAGNRGGVLRHRLGWPLCLLGLVLLLAGIVGAVTGTGVLPFDPHHIVSQAGGVLFAVTGARWATS